MAATQPRPEVGDILLVIHDFLARSSDELTLAKGDRVELLERDDEFGDGWFLGRHLVSNNSGLFPEVYTRPAPKGIATGASALATVKENASFESVPSSSSADSLPYAGTPTPAPLFVPPAAAATPIYEEPRASSAMSSHIPTSAPAAAAPISAMPVSPTTPTASNHPVPHYNSSPASTTPPGSANSASSKAPTPAGPLTPTALSFSSQTSAPANNTASTYSGRVSSAHDSQVLHETLNVIDEHITDLRSPSRINGSMLHAPNDSGSEYSSNLDHRMSYIRGEETDEEEDVFHTREEVEAWGPDDVAEYLFTVGVEKRHCEVFRDQEISGEVLLGMDQASLFIKAFDLGPVGRRLKTWQKIKALQDEVGSHSGFSSSTHNRRRSQAYGSDVGSEDARRSRSSRTNTLTSASNFPLQQQQAPHQQQRLPPIEDHRSSTHLRLSLNQAVMDSAQPISPVSPMSPMSTQRRSILPERRPSAASVRDLHHSRRHSSTDYRASISSMANARLSLNGSLPQAEPIQPLHSQQQQQQQSQQHRKLPSFDRNWTLGNATASPTQPAAGQQQQQQQQQPLFHVRPASSAGLDDVIAQSGADANGNFVADGGLNAPSLDFDRGYFSGTDADNRRRSVLQKKNRESMLRRGVSSNASNTYAEEQRLRSATALSRHSRYGSADSVRNPAAGMSPAAQKYYGAATNGAGAAPHRRTPSTHTSESTGARPDLPPKDTQPPAVTKLDGAGDSPVTASVSSGFFGRSRPSPASPASPAPNRNGTHADMTPSKPGFKTPGFGLRALSDAVSGHDRIKMASPASHADSFPKDSPIQSPSRTGSSTPSAGPSFDLESPDPKSPSTLATVGSGKSSAARKKGKKETSAYRQGLLKRSPREAMVDADYSGWMKKKSSNLMASWKPRLFVLKGRRLAYYYSEDDDEEKGLIDISFHRVLPADNERLTGLHATLTGASTTPAIPANSHVPTLAAAEAAADPVAFAASNGKEEPNTIFIFKLVPPRAGLSRGVSFTKPMVHYFAVPNITQGRLWMAALMKATIDRDESVAVQTTYQQKTISLAKARQMRHRPPALMNLDEKLEDSRAAAAAAAAAQKTDTAAGDGDDDNYGGLDLGDDEKRMLTAALATTTDGRSKVGEKPEVNGLGITYGKNGTSSSVKSATPASTTPDLSGGGGGGGSGGGGKQRAASTTTTPDLISKQRAAAVVSPFRAESARARQFIFEPEKEDEEAVPMSA